MIIFSHANSFPASTYRVLFRSLRGRGFTVKAIEKVGHDPQYPVWGSRTTARTISFKSTISGDSNC